MPASSRSPITRSSPGSTAVRSLFANRIGGACRCAYATDPYWVRNVWVHHNTVDVTNGLKNEAMIGGVVDTGNEQMFHSRNIKFDYNDYTGFGTTHFFTWRNWASTTSPRGNVLVRIVIARCIDCGGTGLVHILRAILSGLPTALATYGHASRSSAGTSVAGRQETSLKRMVNCPTRWNLRDGKLAFSAGYSPRIMATLLRD